MATQGPVPPNTTVNAYAIYPIVHVSGYICGYYDNNARIWQKRGIPKIRLPATFTIWKCLTPSSKASLSYCDRETQIVRCATVFGF